VGIGEEEGEETGKGGRELGKKEGGEVVGERGERQRLCGEGWWLHDNGGN
jgi:hypothetical protein